METELQEAQRKCARYNNWDVSKHVFLQVKGETPNVKTFLYHDGHWLPTPAKTVSSYFRRTKLE